MWMEKIKAGVVVVTKFCRNGAKAFSEYINYIDRKEAARNDNTSKYNLYQDYMGNPEKTTGLFTEDRDINSQKEKNDLKSIFQRAQENGSLMWQTVISFDNRWLEKNGLFSAENQMLDEERIKGITKSAIHRMLGKEGLDNAVWSAAIHYNTDNIHVHVATVEPDPMRTMKEYVQYETQEVNGKTVRVPLRDNWGNSIKKKEFKGTFKQSSLEVCKREIVNQIINERENNLKINAIIRDSIVRQKREHPLSKDKELCQMFLNLYQNMPDCNRNMWNYNNPIMHPLKQTIDTISNTYLMKYHEQDLQELDEWLNLQEQKYAIAYGQNDRSYSETKKADLYSRLGNAILKEILAFDKEFHRGKLSDDIMKQMHNLENNLIDEKGVTNDPLQIDLKEGVINDPYSNVDINTFELEAEEDYFFEDGQENQLRIKWSGKLKAAKKMIHNKQPQYEKAIALLKAEHTSGNLLASYELGDIYRFGRGVAIDMKKADEYYQRSFEGFRKLYEEADRRDQFLNSYLPYRIGKMYYYGIGVETNYKSALDMFENSDNTFSKYMRGKMAYAGQGMEQDYDLAYKLFSQCANDGANAYAAYQAASLIESGKVKGEAEQKDNYYKTALQGFLKLEEKNPSDNLEYRIGCIYLDGKGTEKNEPLAEKYIRTASEAGNIYAKNKLALLYLKRGDMDKIPDIISTLQEVAEKTENIWSMYTLGNIYLSDKYEMQDIEKAIYWYEKAEKDGNKFISYRLGKIYLNKDSEQYSIDKGLAHMEKAYMKGNMMAAYQLGRLYMDKNTEHYDMSKAISYFEIAAANKNALAAYQLGKIFMEKGRAEQNLPKAVYYLKAAAQQDPQYATYQLGKLYYDESYGMRNDNEAYRWFQQSAKEGNIRAVYQMAKIEYGQGKFKDAVTKFEMVDDSYSHYYLGKIYLDDSKRNNCFNPKLGIKYLEQSAWEGNAFAELTLGITYLQGKSVRRDIALAKSWLSKASEHGNQYADELMKNVHGRNNIMNTMQLHLGISLSTAVSKMKKGLKSEWEKTKLQREHELMIDQNLEQGHEPK